MKNLIDRINLKREIRSYAKYVKLNVRRKSKEGGLKMYQALDGLRRRVGFVR